MKWLLSTGAISFLFGDSGDIDNLAPMNQNLNQGKWKQMEK
ncbi:DNA/RNA non-specific endonuclease [Salinithrix halophila]|uniref:DNA/RNA non-specific endonuclease n=1 Tax=Salinithrix halophila TaxID=1485204 RepID=A0ABV8JFV7_9BACL